MRDARPRSRNRLLLIAALASFALAADTLLWTLACRRLDDGAHDAARQAGLEVNTTPARWSGWPLAAAVSYAGTTLRNGPAAAPWLWTIPTLTLRESAWDPFHLVVTAAGRQTFTLGNNPDISFTAATSAAIVDLAQPTPPRLVIESLTVETPAPLRLANATLTLTLDGWSADLSGLSLPVPTAVPSIPPSKPCASTANSHRHSRHDRPFSTPPKTGAPRTDGWTSSSAPSAGAPSTRAPAPPPPSTRPCSPKPTVCSPRPACLPRSRNSPTLASSPQPPPPPRAPSLRS